MSISSEITRLQTAKANIKTSIENKGVTVPSATKLDGYPTLIDSIPSGGSAVIEPLSVTANGTYTAPTGVDGYSPVSVNVSGGGGGSVSPKQINFFDYDGTCLHSFTASEWANETALPSNPSHTGLTAQGWNWTKAQIDAQLVSTPEQDINVGQMYITASGDTEIDIELKKKKLDLWLGICPKGTVDIDWGDGSAVSTVTGTSLTKIVNTEHTYASAGKYMIKLNVTGGTCAIVGGLVGTTYVSLFISGNKTVVNENAVYSSSVKTIRLGDNMNIGDHAFRNFRGLTNITLPSRLTSVGSYAFLGCNNLTSITIPSGVESIGASCFSNCSVLESALLPSGLVSVNTSTFSYNYMLSSVTIPSTVTNIDATAFRSCYILTCITLPSTVTNIGNNAFYDWYGAKEYHIKPTTPPKLGTTVFNNIPSDCIIYVPSASLNTYKTASNWSTYASYMQGE